MKGTGAQLEWLGRRDEVAAVMPDPGEGAPASGAWFDVDLEAWLDNFGPGEDGTGLTVGILEGGRFDGVWNLSGLASGSCVPTSGDGSPTYLCHCPSAGANAGNDSHSRSVAGMIRNRVLSQGADGKGGMADDVRVISANFGGSCTSNGPDQYSSAINWATANGASVLNQSWTFAAGTPENSNDRLLDWTAAHYPYPIIVAAAGNGGNGTRVTTNMLFGLVVGAADDHGSSSRSSATLAGFSADVNYIPGGSSSAYGYELPHVVAPGVNTDTAGLTLNTTSLFGGTSAASPQVAGLAASVQEWNPSIVEYPEVMMAGTLVTADQNVSGIWPLQLTDGLDDSDGAGLINALGMLFVMAGSSKSYGGNAAVAYGHDYDTVSESANPAGTYYSEVYNASVANNQTLRAAVVELGAEYCGGVGTPSGSDCTATSYPDAALYIYSGTTMVGASINSYTNYQLASVTNTSGSTQTYQIKIFYSMWPGTTNPSAYQAIAWEAS